MTRYILALAAILAACAVLCSAEYGTPSSVATLAAETAARIAADSTLQGNITAASNAANAAAGLVQTNLNTASNHFDAAVGTVQTNLNTHAGLTAGFHGVEGFASAASGRAGTSSTQLLSPSVLRNWILAYNGIAGAGTVDPGENPIAGGLGGAGGSVSFFGGDGGGASGMFYTEGGVGGAGGTIEMRGGVGGEGAIASAGGAGGAGGTIDIRGGAGYIEFAGGAGGQIISAGAAASTANGAGGGWLNLTPGEGWIELGAHGTSVKLRGAGDGAAYDIWMPAKTGTVAMAEDLTTLSNLVALVGCTDLGTNTNVVVTGSTEYYQANPALPYTLSVNASAPRRGYFIRILSTNTCTLSGITLDGSWTVTGTNTVSITPGTGTTWLIYARGL